MSERIRPRLEHGQAVTTAGGAVGQVVALPTRGTGAHSDYIVEVAGTRYRVPPALVSAYTPHGRDDMCVVCGRRVTPADRDRGCRLCAHCRDEDRHVTA